MLKRELAPERTCTKESMIEIITAMNCAERVNKKTLFMLSLCKKKKEKNWQQKNDWKKSHTSSRKIPEIPYVQMIEHNNFSQLPGKECITQTGLNKIGQEDHSFTFCLPIFQRMKSPLYGSKSTHPAQGPQWQISWWWAAALWLPVSSTACRYCDNVMLI